MLTFECTDTFDYSAAAVFGLLTDLEARSSWSGGEVFEKRITPEGPARLGTSYFESGKYEGYKSEKTLFVTEFEPEHLLTLATAADAPQSFRTSYQIESLDAHTCRVTFTDEVGGVPKVAEFFMRQSMKKGQPKTVERLKSILASRSYQAG
jgi:uncharacterized protein YndB with AHSA1/START domain